MFYNNKNNLQKENNNKLYKAKIQRKGHRKNLEILKVQERKDLESDSYFFIRNYFILKIDFIVKSC